MNQAVLLLVNPFSGDKKGVSLAHKVKSFWKDIPFTEVISQYPGHFHDYILRESLGSYKVICVIGGDGSMSEVLNALYVKQEGPKPPVFLLPAGGGNALNHDLANLDFDIALQKLGQLKTMKIDLLKLSLPTQTYYAFNMVGWGLVSDINQSSERLRFLGGLRYTLGALLQIVKNKVYAGEMWVGEELMTGPFSFGLFLNTIHTGKSMKMAPNALLDDGLMDILLVNHQSIFTLLKLFPKIFSGSHIGAKELQYVQAKKVKVSGTPMPLVVDGEVMGSCPFSIEVIPQAIKIVI